MMGLGMRFRALVAAVGLLFLAVTVDAVADTKVNSVRLWRAPDNTRLVFDLTGPGAAQRVYPDGSGSPGHRHQWRDPRGAAERQYLEHPDHRHALGPAHADRPAGGHRPEKSRHAEKLLPWRRTPSTATGWWSICSITPPTPRRPPAPTNVGRHGARRAGHAGRTGDQIAASPGRQTRHHCGDRRRPRWRRPGRFRLPRPARERRGAGRSPANCSARSTA